MASLQKKGDAWYCQLTYRHKRHTFTIGKVPKTEALQWKVRSEQLLMRLRQGLIEVPRGVSLADFILHDGKPPSPVKTPATETILSHLREAYLKTVSNGAVEANTLKTSKIHLAHIEETFGKRFLLSALTHEALQGHIDRRRNKVSPVTIKKEIDTFRSAWNWAKRMNWVDEPFPSSGLVYPKISAKLPFMTWSEIVRRIKAGGNKKELWEALYLDTDQIGELLDYAKTRKAPDWVYPMIVAAAHTGARRSELIRARTEDVDFTAGVITIREKKRSRGVLTTRRVPISSLLTEALKPAMNRQNGKAWLFGTGDKPLSVQATQKAFVRILKGSKWSVLKGWHTLRHSFISILANSSIDQRIIDDFVGHQTDEQRRRYRHLMPDVTNRAIQQVFGR